MEKLIDIFCHAIRITDPLSIKIAVGIVGGGLPLIFLIAALIKLGDFAAWEREITMPTHQVQSLFQASLVEACLKRST